MRKSIGVSTILALLMAATPAMAGGGQSNLSEARTATARFHEVSHAENAGYGSTLSTLGCFENPGVGGMGVHYVNGGFLEDGLAVAAEPEALVYEMRSDGRLKLVALEYLVPITDENFDDPPMLFGRHFHMHPVLPFWILHTWIWEPNPDGMFADWNPNVALCPDEVPVFGS